MTRDATGQAVDNIFLAIASVGHDEDYVPMKLPKPTNAWPGSPEKVEVLRRRVEAGERLWHPADRNTLLKRGEHSPTVRDEVSTAGLNRLNFVRLPRVL